MMAQNKAILSSCGDSGTILRAIAGGVGVGGGVAGGR